MKRLNEKLQKHVLLLLERYPALAPVATDIVDAYLVLEDCYRRGGKLLIAGNGGSAADAEHIVGELMKSFVLKRKLDQSFVDQLLNADPEMGKVLSENLQGALPAIALDGHFALSTAYTSLDAYCLVKFFKISLFVASIFKGSDIFLPARLTSKASLSALIFLFL